MEGLKRKRNEAGTARSWMENDPWRISRVNIIFLLFTFNTGGVNEWLHFIVVCMQLINN